MARVKQRFAYHEGREGTKATKEERELSALPPFFVLFVPSCPS